MSEYGLGGAASGFMQGFDFMDRTLGRRDEATRRDRMETRQMGLQDAQEARSKEAHDANMRNTNLNYDDAQIKRGLAGMRSGAGVTDEQMEVLARYGLTPDNMDTAGTELAILDQAAKQAQETGDFSVLNRPEVLKAFNSRYAPDIGTGNDGKEQLLPRWVTGILPGPDGQSLVFNMAGENEDGTKWKDRPMTKDRSSRDDAEVLQQKVGPLKRKADAQKLAILAYKKDPEFRKRVDDFYAARNLGKGDAKPMTVNPGQGVYVPGKGFDVEPDADKFRRGGASGSMPSEAQLIEYYVTKGIADDHKSAQKMVRRARENPRSEAAKIALKLTPEFAKDEDKRRIYNELYREHLALLTEDEVEQEARPAPGGLADAPKAGAGDATKADKTYTHPNGETVTWRQIEDTAKNRGLTTDQVIQQLNLK